MTHGAVECNHRVQHRYARLGYVALNVSDVIRSAAFYERVWGMQPNGGATDDVRFFRCSSNHHDLILYKGEPGLKRVSWQMETESDVDNIAGLLRSHGGRGKARR